MDDARTRYCQRCAKEQLLSSNDTPRPCVSCGGSQFAQTPPPHSRLITEADREFLKIQGISWGDEAQRIKFSSWRNDEQE
jgi:hypothetical protein